MNTYKNTITIFVFLFLIFNTSPTFTQTISPHLEIKTSGAITDFFIEDDKAILSTDAGTIETYNLNTGVKINFIQLPEMKDFMGDPVPTKVYSIDKFSEKLLIVTQGHHGFRDIYILNGEERLKLIDSDLDKMLVKKARFINENQILLGTMSNELILFNIEKREILYTLSISPYTFSDFTLSEDKQFAFSSDESGIVHKINIQQGKVTEEFSGNNVDNVYKLYYKNGTIITAGQDRRVGIYQTSIDQKYYVQKDFLIYCVSLNKVGNLGAFTADEENNITLFDLNLKSEISSLKGHESVVTKIEFVDENILLSSSEDGYLMIWKMKR